MSITAFSINDLLRRKFQTALAIITVALCVSSILFLLLFAEKMGIGILSASQDRLSLGLSVIFSRFILFIGFVSFVAGATIISFTVSMMIYQRMKDIGLMRAAGCPNELVFGYFLYELLIVAFVGCCLGIATGLIFDYVFSAFFMNFGGSSTPGLANLWLVLLVFVLFFVLSAVLGAKPILDSTKLIPARVLSPSYALGISKESDFRGSAKAGLTVKIAIRSLFRRKSSSLRIVLCLTSVFILLTISVGGGIVAGETTKSWIEGAVGSNVIVVAHEEMCEKYETLLASFYEEKAFQPFNYSDQRYRVPDELLTELENIPGLAIESRLMVETQVEEIKGILLEQETGKITSVGDNRKGTSLIVGIEPSGIMNGRFLNGEPLKDNQGSEAIIGDTIALSMFSEPLIQNIVAFGNSFRIVATCIDPLSSGNVTYVPINVLQRIAGLHKPNLIMAKINVSDSNYDSTLEQVQAAVEVVAPSFTVYELNTSLARSLEYLDGFWSTAMLLPLLLLVSATLCLVGYVMLALTEQRQEFAIMRSIGAKQYMIIKIVAVQNFLFIISSLATGIALGTTIVLLVLIPQPLITGYTIAKIAAWLVIASLFIFALSIYPALRFARKPILEMIA